VSREDIQKSVKRIYPEQCQENISRKVSRNEIKRATNYNFKGMKALRMAKDIHI